MFNLGPGEIVVMAALAFIFLSEHRAQAARAVARWSRSDWLRVGAAASAISAALVLLSGVRY